MQNLCFILEVSLREIDSLNVDFNQEFCTSSYFLPILSRGNYVFL